MVVDDDGSLCGLGREVVPLAAGVVVESLAVAAGAGGFVVLLLCWHFGVL